MNNEVMEEIKMTFISKNGESNENPHFVKARDIEAIANIVDDTLVKLGFTNHFQNFYVHMVYSDYYASSRPYDAGFIFATRLDLKEYLQGPFTLYGNCDYIMELSFIAALNGDRQCLERYEYMEQPKYDKHVPLEHFAERNKKWKAVFSRIMNNHQALGFLEYKAPEKKEEPVPKKKKST